MKSIIVMAFFLFVLAAVFLFGGANLLILGGSAYYIVTGFLLLLSAIALLRKSKWGIYLYSLILIGSTFWALWEGGFDPWALLPRLGLLTGIGLILFLPKITRLLEKGPTLENFSARGVLAISVIVPILSLLSAALFGGFQDGKTLNLTLGDYQPAVMENRTIKQPLNDEWTATSGTSSGKRFSSLTDINPENVQNLTVAWTYSFAEEEPKGLQATPIKIGDALYLCSATNVVVSLDLTTGQEKWRFDPHVDLDQVIWPVCRGVAYYHAGGDGHCADRIYTATVDARLLAVDAHSGKRCEGFGVNGEIDLTVGMGEVQKGYYSVTSAPLIARGKIVMGGGVMDNQYWGEPSGVIRAFDAISGELAWAYDVGRPLRKGLPPENDSYTHSTPNSWAPMSYDDTLGLVYVPAGNPSLDFFGGLRRPFDDEISSSVMALDIETGNRRWLFQTVHHDVWDYDVASQPVAVDLPAGDQTRKALLVATKRGEVFLLDRETGVPIDPVEERPVPLKDGVAEDRLSPTQPFPKRMPSLSGGKLTEAMMWGLTPIDQMWCRIAFRKARYEGTMTPPGLTPSIQYPGFLGGMNWGGLSVDPQRGIMVAVTSHVANDIQLIPRSEADRMGIVRFGDNPDVDALTHNFDYNAQDGAPFAVRTMAFLSPLEVPCQQPPWSRLSAVDLNTLQLLWSKPLGTGQENGPLGLKSRLPLTMGVPALGGSLVTASGITFIAASVDRKFRAFDTATGALLWETSLPASGNAHPMTYRSKDGRQYVVIAAGGHKYLGSKDGDSLVAFVLPE